MSEPLAIGTRAPDFTLRNADNEAVSLSDFRGSPVVLIFYPLDWSPTCSDQLSLYQSELPEFARYGAKLVGISVDSIYSHGAFAAVRGITYPLLADFEPKGDVARRYNVWRPGDGFSERAIFVIDGTGVIRYAHVSPRLGEIPDTFELYAALTRITGQPEPAHSDRRTDRCREVRRNAPRRSLVSAIGADTGNDVWHVLVRGQPDGAPHSRLAWEPLHPPRHRAHPVRRTAGAVAGG